jgi:hypothetical protein
MCENNLSSTIFETNINLDTDLNLIKINSSNKPKKKVSFENNIHVSYVQSFKKYNKIKVKNQKEKINDCKCSII